MKIRFLVSAAGIRFNYKKGGEYNIPPLEAEGFIRSGLAVLVKDTGIEQHKIQYENAIQVSNETDNVPIKPVRSKTTSKSNIHRRGSENKRTNKKRN